MCFLNRHTKSFFLCLTKGNDDDEKYIGMKINIIYI